MASDDWKQVDVAELPNELQEAYGNMEGYLSAVQSGQGHIRRASCKSMWQDRCRLTAS